MIPTVRMETLLNNARSLRSEQGENPEYDRALLELCGDTLGFAEDARFVLAMLLDLDMDVLYPNPNREASQ